MRQCSCHRTDGTCHWLVEHLAAPYMNMHIAWLAVNEMMSSFGLLFLVCVVKR